MVKTLLEEASCDFYGDPKLRLCQDIFVRFDLCIHNSYSKLLKITYPADSILNFYESRMLTGAQQSDFFDRKESPHVPKRIRNGFSVKNTP